MKKILIATGLYPPESGGPATYTKLLEDHLPPLGFEIRVLPFRTVRHLPKLVRHLAYFFKLLRFGTHVEIIYALDTVSVGLPAALAAKLLGKKLILRVPGDYAWEQGRQRFGVTDELEEFQTKKYGFQVEFLRGIQTFVARRATNIIVPSEYMWRIVSSWVMHPQKIEVIYSSIDSSVLPEIPPERPEGFLVVSTGRPVSWKGFDAIERVVARESGWNFFLGKNLPRAQALGWVKVADVFVLNSTYEGLSHALIEAMMLGTPVIATNVGGNPELIANGSEGLIIPPKDDEALYAALKEIEAHPDEARSRAARAEERAKDFSIEVTIQKLATLLKSL
jgi:glycosyltransferase involved in cell wall biosynthesis